MTAAGQPGNRGNGGGGGGTGLLGGSSGGNGGGGGGVIELRADGRIVLSGAAGVLAHGGDGGEGSLGGGGGGGGAGGAVLLHGAAGIVNDTGVAVVSATGGTGGTRGGSGAPGRVRVDGATVPSTLVASPTPVRGPVWHPDTATIVRAPSVAAVLTGSPGRMHAVWVNESEHAIITIGGGGTQTVNVSLSPGANRICVFAGTAADFSAEGTMCRSVAYVP